MNFCLEKPRAWHYLYTYKMQNSFMGQSIRKAFILFLALLPLTLAAQSVRKYSNEFLKIGVGARAAAMGNAMTGIVDDVTAGYWNPGGLAMAPAAPEIALMHSE